MKKLITLFSLAICFLFIGNVKAQVLFDNGDFEEWTNVFFPQKWSSLSITKSSQSGPMLHNWNLLPHLNTLDAVKPEGRSAKIVTDTGVVSSAEDFYIFGTPLGTRYLYPTVLVTGNFTMDFDQGYEKAMQYYAPLWGMMQNYAFTTIIDKAPEYFLAYVQNKPKIVNDQVPTKVEGYYQYAAADYKKDNLGIVEGVDRPMIVAYAVQDINTGGGFSSRVIYKGEYTVDAPSTEDTWEKFEINMKKVHDSIQTKPTNFVVLFMPSRDSANMTTAYENRVKDQLSMLVVDEIKHNGNLDIKNLSPVYPDGLAFEVLPTLSNGTVTVKLPTGTADITVYNTQGNVVLKKFCKDGENLNIPSSGSFVVKAVANGKQGTRKIIVTR